MTKKHVTGLVAVLLIMVFTGVLQTSWEARGQDPYQYFRYFPLVFKPVPSPKWIGPGGGTFTAVVIDPKNANIMYAASFGAGVFKSTDGGSTWFSSSSGLTNPLIQSLTVDPVNTNILYAGGYKQGLYKSVNGGASWYYSSSGLQAEATIYSIVVDPMEPKRVLLSTRGISDGDLDGPWNGVIYRSLDYGATWQAILKDVTCPTDEYVVTQDWAYSLALHPYYRDYLYAAFHECGPYVNWKRGEPGNWARMDWDKVSNKSGRVIAIRPRWEINATMFYGVWHTDSNNGVYRTIYAGGGWLLQTSGLVPSHIKSMGFNPITPTTVYIGTFGSGFKVSTNDGLNWSTRSLLDVDGIYSIAPVPDSSTNIFIGTSSNGILKSTDTGYTWSYVPNGVNASQVTGLVVIPGTGIIGSTYGSGAFLSTNEGSTWASIGGTGERYFTGLAADPADPTRVFGLTSTQGLWFYNGSVWTTLTLPTSIATFDTSNKIPPLPFSPLEAMDDVDREEFRSEDTGEIGLTAVDQAYSTLWELEFAPSNPSIAYLGTGNGLMKSTDRGATWVKTAMTGSTIALAVDPLNANAVAASYGACTTYFSTDGGGTWSQLNFPTCTDLALYSLEWAGEPKTLYAATSKGLYRYQSGNWSLTSLTSATLSIATDPHDPQRLFAGTPSGAYLSVDGGASWTPGPGGVAGTAVTDIVVEDNGNYISAYYLTTTRSTYKQNYEYLNK